MRKLSIGLIFLILFVGVSPACADEVTIEGFAKLNYPNPIVLKKSGCQYLAFSYVTDDLLPRQDTVFLVQLVHKTKKIVYGGAAWMSPFTSKGKDVIPAMARIGTLEAKVCRNSWSATDGKNRTNYPGVKPGWYRIYFAGVYVDPITGSKLGEKIEMFKTVKIN